MMRRAIRIFGWTMIWSGLMTLGYASYQLWGTGLATAAYQEQARTELAVVFSAQGEDPPPDPGTGPGPASEPVLISEMAAPAGTPFAAIRIPSLGVDEVVFEGTTREALQRGPGHIEGTPIPGQPGNAAISGHRTTYGAPFFDLDQIAPGDTIEVETSIGIHEFVVRELIVVLPTDVWVISPRPGAWLTLTTCNPAFSARERLVIFAELSDGPNLDFIQAAQAA